MIDVKMADHQKVQLGNLICLQLINYRMRSIANDTRIDQHGEASG